MVTFVKSKCSLSRMPLNPALRERLERCSSLPTLPAVAIRILELCQKDNLDLVEIAAMISNDPSLAAKLIKTANSPIFAVRREVTTISYAISLLGINAIRTLVLSFSLSKTCQTGNTPGLKDYWQRSVLSALAAREVCQGDQIGSRDEAFLCGLLQDIGMLALARVATVEYPKLLAEANRDHDKLIQLERAALGADHAEVGAWLLDRWRAPRLLAEIVAASHEAGRIDSDEELSFLAKAVAISGRFADLWAGNREVAPALLSRELAGLWPDGGLDSAAVSARLIEHAPQLAPLFEVKLDASEMASVLEEAQEVMLSLSVRASQELNDIHDALQRLESRTATLLVEAQRDPLTGVANRGYINTYLEEVFRAAVELSRHIGVIFADVDHFKLVNDTYGHSAGDTVLQSVAQRITQGLRGGDFVGRYGGEEFVIIIRANDDAELLTVAERLRQTIAGAPHSIGNGRSIPVTISLGCTLLDKLRHLTSRALIEEADTALYAAKRGGRNRCELSMPAAVAGS